MSDRVPPTPFPLGWSSAMLASATLCGVVLAAAVLHGMGQPSLLGGVAGMAVAALVVAMLAQLPLWWASRRAPDSLPLSVLAGSVLRLMLTSAAAPLVWVMSGIHPVPLAFAAGGWYLLLLLVEVAALRLYLLRTEPERKEATAC